MKSYIFLALFLFSCAENQNVAKTPEQPKQISPQQMATKFPPAGCQMENAIRVGKCQVSKYDYPCPESYIKLVCDARSDWQGAQKFAKSNGIDEVIMFIPFENK